MKIVSLRAENYKRLKAVEIHPTEDTVVISGRNGQGKSSVLDAMWETLCGSAADRATRPIRDGADKAEVTVDLGDLLVTRRWSSSGGSTLTVRGADGAKIASPQAVLDRLISRTMFDPLQFAHAPAKSQVALLATMVDLPINLDDVAGERKALYDQRTTVGRAVRDLQAQIEAAGPVDPDLPDEEVSVAALFAELREAEAAVVAYEALVDEADNLEEAANETEAEIAGLEFRLAQLREGLVEKRSAAARARQRAANLDADLVDVDDITKRIEGAEELNRKVRARNDLEKLVAQQAERSLERDTLTKQIDALDNRKTEALAKAEMPVEDLSFDEEGVMFQGVPFSQCSSAEQLRISMEIAMAGEPEIRIARVTDGSLLDNDGLLLVAELAAKHDTQVWIERVSDGEAGIGVVIEDGEVVG